MGMFKSLGSPAKKAGAATSKVLRRLFGRAVPDREKEGAEGDDSEGRSEQSRRSQRHEEDESSDSPRKASLNNHRPSKTANHHKDDGDGDNNSNNGDSPESGTNKGGTLNASTNPGQQRPAPTAPAPAPASPSSTSPHLASDVRDFAPDTMVAIPQLPSHFNKENQPPSVEAAVDALAVLSLKTEPVKPVVDPSAAQPAKAPINVDDAEPLDDEEKERHLRFTEEALDMARLALRTNETPVGCVLVHKDKVIARGMNATNVTRNGTRHAEFMALSALFSISAKTGPKTTCLKPKIPTPPPNEGSDAGSVDSHQPDEGNEDGSKSHLYPYGQKEHPDRIVHPSIIHECTLYVTVEPCIMCASLLRQFGIKKVYFGAVNDKFGGTGGVFSIHANSLPIRPDGQTASAHPTPRPRQLPDGNWTLGVSYPPGGGDGGNIEPGYEIEGGWGRDEAVALLRRFYVQENGRAPVPRKKEGRAARLAAMMEQDSEGPPDGLVSGTGEGGEPGDIETPSGEAKDTQDAAFPVSESDLTNFDDLEVKRPEPSSRAGEVEDESTIL